MLKIIHCLALLTFAAATPAHAQLESTPGILASPEARHAALWLGGRLRLEDSGRADAPSPSPALLGTIRAWAAGTARPDAEAEMHRLARILRASLDEVSRTYAERDERIGFAAMAYRELENAVADKGSPIPALAYHFRASSRSLVNLGGPTPFDRLEDEVASAFTEAIRSLPTDAVVTQGSAPAGGVVVTQQAPRMSLEWIGSQRDVVGAMGPGADGRTDIEFSLRHDSGAKPLAMINLTMRGTDGQLCCHAWSTYDAQYSYIGLVDLRNPSVIGPNGRATQGLGQMQPDLRIIASGADLFIAGTVAVATIVYADGTFVQADARVGSAPTIAGNPQPPNAERPQLALAPPSVPPQSVQASSSPADGSFAWAGTGADLAAHTYRTGPDGNPDGTFRFTLPAGSAAARSLAIERVNEAGVPTGTRWSTDNPGNWILYVASGGKQISARDYTADIGLAPGTYLLHIADDGGLV